MVSGNTFSFLALLLWFPLALVVASQTTAQRTIIVVVVGGTLLLPEKLALAFPGITLDKHAVALLAALLGLLSFHSRTLKHSPASTIAPVLSLLLLVGSLMTVVTNGDRLDYGSRHLPALGVNDIRATWTMHLLHLVLPFYLGSSVFRGPDDLKSFLRDFVLAGVIYMPLVWLEIRLAPFLHQQVYGYFHHSFAQMRRAGGFRAIVFMAHGLAVALLVSQSVIGAFGISRAKIGFPLPIGPVAWLLFVTLVLSKSLGSLIFALTMVPVTLFLSARLQGRIAQVIALVVLAYPLLRLYELVPIEWLLERAYAIDPEREASLRFRFDNEDLLLEKALQRPFFGWGSWGRNRVFDPLSGDDLSVTDGTWIISLGVGGVFYFLVQFGTMLLPVFRANRVLKRRVLGQEDARVVAVLAAMLALFCLDLIPNALFHDLPVLLAGALFGGTSRYLKPESPAQGQAGAGPPRE